MPRIIIVAECASQPHRVLEERVVAAQLDSEHSSAQVVERVGWAIVDADALERADNDYPSRRSTRAR